MPSPTDMCLNANCCISTGCDWAPGQTFCSVSLLCPSQVLVRQLQLLLGQK
jgi:hypothetical protein